jgi:sugar lactone lactonase YvrE
MKISFPIPLLLTAALFISACGKKNNDTGTPIIPIIPSSVITFAGNGTAGAIDATKEQAAFNFPTGITISTDGFLFVADKQNQLIRIISPAGVVNTISGYKGIIGFNNAVDSVTYNFPAAVAVNSAGLVYVADQSNHAIRTITTSGGVATFATGFTTPSGVAVDFAGNVFVADDGSNLITKLSAKAVGGVFAGKGRGAVNGVGVAASFNQPEGLAADASGNIYVADKGNNLIRKITTDGTVTTFAGSGTAGATNGVGTAASFNGPTGIALDASGNVYVADSNNNLIRKITTDGTVTTLAGTGTAGLNNGTLTTATFNNPQGLVVDSFGRIFVVDTGNSVIRMITIQAN